MKRNDCPNVLRLDSESLADLLQFSRSGGVLTSGHSGRQVVRDADRDARPGVDAVQKAGHPAVGECGVSDHRHGRPHTGIGGTKRHSDGSAHLDAGLERVERRHISKSVATYVTEHTCRRGIFLKHHIKRGVEIPVAASLAKRRRTRDSYL